MRPLFSGHYHCFREPHVDELPTHHGYQARLNAARQSALEFVSLTA